MTTDTKTLYGRPIVDHNENYHPERGLGFCILVAAMVYGGAMLWLAFNLLKPAFSAL